MVKIRLIFLLPVGLTRKNQLNSKNCPIETQGRLRVSFRVVCLWCRCLRMQYYTLRVHPIGLVVNRIFLLTLDVLLRIVLIVYSLIHQLELLLGNFCGLALISNTPRLDSLLLDTCDIPRELPVSFSVANSRVLKSRVSIRKLYQSTMFTFSNACISANLN